MTGTYGKKSQKEEISEAPQVEELLRNLEFHKAIQRITTQINSAVTLREIVIDIKEDIRKLFNIHRLTIYLIDKPKREIFTWQNANGQLKELRFPIDYSTFAGCVAQKRKMLHITDAYNEREIKRINDALHFDSSQDKKAGITTGQIIASPIAHDGSLLGIMEIMNKKDGDTIDDYNLIFLDEIESCLARALFLQLEFEQSSLKHRAKVEKLIRDKMISPDQMDRALKEAFEAKKDITLILMERYNIAKSDIGAALSDHFSCPFVAYSDDLPIARHLFAGIEQSTLAKMVWIPLTVAKGKIHVAVDDPWDQIKRRNIEKALETNSIQYHVALATDILKLIDRSCSEQEEVSAPISSSVSSDRDQKISREHDVGEIPTNPDTEAVREKIIIAEPEPSSPTPQDNVTVLPDTEPAWPAKDQPTPSPQPQSKAQVPPPESRLRETQAASAATLPSGNLRQMAATKNISEASDGIITKPAIHHIPTTFSNIILEAAGRQASDVHFEPDPVNKHVALRIRIDRQFQNLQPLNYGEYEKLMDEVKTLAHLDAKNRSIIQHAELTLKRPSGDDINLRVTIIPTQTGREDAVIHISAKSRKIPLELLGLSTGNYSDLVNILQQPRGMILVVGPAGNGMNTTLHACLENINTPEKKIWTAEESVEITQNGLRQVAVDPQQGFDLPGLLRSFLDADPDVIMTSRLPDLETTRLCMEAALQGRLVLSSLWADSMIDAIEKCLLMGISHMLFADAMLSIVEQRLIKLLCPKCKGKYNPSQAEYEELAELYGKDAFAKLNRPYSSSLTLFHPRGCKACGNTGYSGRVCVSEILIFTPEIKRLIRRKESSESIYQTAVARGMATLMQDGICKVLEGHSDSRHVRLACLK